ncbi:MAG: type III polyketide synthase [Bacteroidetes bacterium]|nr:type III polyketide synthase [Bacteroidota bacterium]
MSKIISIGTSVPAHRHQQEDILHFMQKVYAMNEPEKRKLKFLYHQSGINTRYSVIPDYSRELPDWKFYPHSENLEPFPSLETRMTWYNKQAAPLSVDAIRNCLESVLNKNELTHLVTVSCTGMSAPGLDLQLMEMMDLPKTLYRTSVNFMGCYAAIHALKIADAICHQNPAAKILIVCTELCTLHFQREPTMDNIASGLLFSDGSAAVLVTANTDKHKGLLLNNFYSEVISKGKRDMSWELSSSGFLMTLSGYVPELIEEDFEPLVKRALMQDQLTTKDIKHWCIHPGGRRILDAVQKTLNFTNGELTACYEVLKNFGNMSSPTILFVLKEILKKKEGTDGEKVFGAAFGPGLTMETFTATIHA